MHTADWHLQEAEDLLKVGGIHSVYNADLLRAQAELATAHVQLATAMFTQDQIKLANEQLRRANGLLEDRR